MSVKALLEKRSEVHKELKRLGDVSADDKHVWTPEDQTAWDKINGEYDALTQRIDRAKKAEVVTARDIEIMGWGRKQTLREVDGPGAADASASGPHLVDEKGRELRTYRHGESISAAHRAAGADEGEKPLSVGRCIRALLTNQIDDLEPHERRAMLAGSDTGGGYLLTSPLSSALVDLARSAAVCLRAGALTVPMETSELSIARLTQDPTATWKMEGQSFTSNDMLFDRIVLRPKTLVAAVPISVELAMDAPNAAGLIDAALAAALGLKLDQAALLGSGAGAEPRGVVNEPGGGTVAAVGANMGGSYAKLTEAIGKIFNANFTGEAGGLSLVLHPRDMESLDSLLDTTNQPLAPTPWAGALKKFTTTSLPVNLGGGSNESNAVVGSFGEMVIGVRTQIVVQVLDAGSIVDQVGVTRNATSDLIRIVRAFLRADVAILRPSWFTVLTGILA